MSVLLAGIAAFLLRDVEMASLFLGLLLAFVVTHIVLTMGPIRRGLVGRLGEKGFQAAYSLLSILLLGGAIFAYRALEPYPLWVAPGWAWPLSSALMLAACILFAGSLTPANKALAGVFKYLGAFGSSPNLRAPKPTVAPVTSRIGHITRSRKRS